MGKRFVLLELCCNQEVVRAVEEIEATLQEIEAIPRVNFRFSEPSQLKAARASCRKTCH